MNFLNIFSQSKKCPYCNEALSSPPTRKQKCPHCDQFIYVRQGKLVTKDQSTIIDWLSKLESYGITREYFQKQRKDLSAQFGFKANVNDTIWRILNQLVTKYANSPNDLRQIYQLMSSHASSEGKDPSPYLEQAASITSTQGQTKDRIFLGHDELKHIRRLRKENKLDKAEKLLFRADPSPAVLDEIRKTKSVRARIAKENDDWHMVIEHLEAYIKYAEKNEQYCLDMVNQAPPKHTERDLNLLAKAKEQVEKS